MRTFTDAIVNVAFMAEQADLTREGAEMERGRGDFGRARSAFVEAASAYAGSQLPRRSELKLAEAPEPQADRPDPDP